MRRILENLPPQYTVPARGPVDGKRLVDGAGCLACHRIGARGNRGPGADLSRIGSQRTPAQIRRALVSPRAPMPSYRALPRRGLDALVAYLSSLRAD